MCSRDVEAENASHSLHKRIVRKGRYRDGRPLVRGGKLDAASQLFAGRIAARVILQCRLIGGDASHAPWEEAVGGARRVTPPPPALGGRVRRQHPAVARGGRGAAPAASGRGRPTWLLAVKVGSSGRPKTRPTLGAESQPRRSFVFGNGIVPGLLYYIAPHTAGHDAARARGAVRSSPRVVACPRSSELPGSQ
jgi:hypothetical protein